jgi:hypothetical protein
MPSEQHLARKREFTYQGTVNLASILMRRCDRSQDSGDAP